LLVIRSRPEIEGGGRTERISKSSNEKRRSKKEERLGNRKRQQHNLEKGEFKKKGSGGKAKDKGEL